MPKYHISRKTGRPNICNATIKDCPIGGAHYSSKEEARNASEKTAANENSLLPKTLSKKAAPTSGSELKKWPKTSAPVSREQILILKNNIDEALASPERMKDAVLGTFESSAEYERPGCSGCQYPHDDYCRCGTYTGNFEPVSVHEIASTMATYAIKDDLRNDLEARKALTKAFQPLVSHHNLAEEDNYEVQAYGDYYGDVIDRIDVNGDAERNIKNFQRDLESILSSR